MTLPGPGKGTTNQPFDSAVYPEPAFSSCGPHVGFWVGAPRRLGSCLISLSQPPAGHCCCKWFLWTFSDLMGLLRKDHL